MSRPAEPRHPEIEVGVTSPNPLVLVAEVRHALRRAHVARREISEFSDEALAPGNLGRVAEVCRSWVRLRE